MAASGKDFPSLPLNYVTLAQLQERWLKKQQREKEEEEDRNRREEEEERRKLLEQENRKMQNDSGEIGKQNTAFPHRPLQKHRRNQSSGGRRMSDFKGNKRDNELEDRERIDHENRRRQHERERGKASTASLSSSRLSLQTNRWNQSEKGSESTGEREMDATKEKNKDNENKKKRKEKRRRKGRAEEHQTRGTAKAAEMETIPAVFTAGDGVMEVVTSELEKIQLVNDSVWKEKVPVDRTAKVEGRFRDLSTGDRKATDARDAWRNGKGHRTGEIGRRFGKFSPSGWKGGGARAAAGRNVQGERVMYGRGSRRFGGKPSGSSLVWVRKEGVLSEGGEDEKKPG